MDNKIVHENELLLTLCYHFSTLIGKSKTGKDTKIVSKESIKSDEIGKKIVVVQSEEEKAKDIWQEEEVVIAPEALDVVSDNRTRPEYDVKYQQYVGSEDTFLQVN